MEMIEIQNLKEKLNSLKTSTPIICQEESEEKPFLNEIQKELRSLRRELKTFSCNEGRSSDPILEKSFYKILLDLHEENFSLKAKIKSFGGAHSSSTSSSESQVVGHINKLRNENADLSRQIDLYKNKECGLWTKIDEMESKMMNLKIQLSSSQAENSTLMEEIAKLEESSGAEDSVSNEKMDWASLFLPLPSDKSTPLTQVSSPNTHNEDYIPESSILRIPNLRTSSTKNEQIRYVLLNKIHQVPAFFDEVASISICGPGIMKFCGSRNLKPAQYTHYQFASGDVHKCLGVADIDLSYARRDIHFSNCTIYVFEGVKTLILNRLHWTGSATYIGSRFLK